MRRHIYIVVLFLLQVCFIKSNGQNNAVPSDFQVGELFPDYTFRDVDHFDNKVVTIKSFRGKWLILDYWSEWCGSCVKSFPKMNKIQSEFKDSVKIFMVATFLNKEYSNLNTTRSLYEKLHTQQQLNLTVAYDTILAKTLGVNRIPDIFVIDPEGVLRSRTSNLTPELLLNIMNDTGTEASIYYPSDLQIQERDNNYSTAVPLLINGNGGDDVDFLYRSLIAPRNIKSPPFKQIYENGRVEIISATLKSLFKIAYFGYPYWDLNSTELYTNYYTDPILILNDSSKFFTSDGIEKEYCYSFCYPKSIEGCDANSYSIANNPKLKKRIQLDLKDCFGYEGVFSLRQKPVYKLVAKPEAYNALHTKGKRPSYSKPLGQYKGINLSNCPVSTLIGYLYADAIGLDKSIPIIDETNISENIDIDLIGSTLNELIGGLKKYGLNLILESKELNCLVIQAPKEK